MALRRTDIMHIDPEGLSRPDRYHLLISAIVPRPIAWVSTRFPEGGVNVAPFSFFNGISSSPPLLMVCVGRRRDGSPKDTLANAKLTGEMVVNIVSRELAEVMVETSAALPPGVSEAEEAGLELADSNVIATPRIAAAPVAFECEVDRTIEFEGTTMIVGRIVSVHVSDDVATEQGTVDFDRLRPVGRLGGKEYLDPQEGRFSIDRPG
jgi:flavin reductase (DIM6/NTAB) family NADH-FMN oxidoreductase RutF